MEMYVKSIVFCANAGMYFHLLQDLKGIKIFPNDKMESALMSIKLTGSFIFDQYISLCT